MERASKQMQLHHQHMDYTQQQHQQHQQQQFFSNDIIPDAELYQALSVAVLDDNNDVLPDADVFIPQSQGNNNNVTGVFFHINETAHEDSDYHLHHHLYQPYPYSSSSTTSTTNTATSLHSSSSSTNVTPSFPMVSYPALSSSPVYFNDIQDDNSIESSKKRCLDEFDEPGQQQIPLPLFPDKFQKRKIAKRPLISASSTITETTIPPSVQSNDIKMNIVPINTTIPSPNQAIIGSTNSDIISSLSLPTLVSTTAAARSSSSVAITTNTKEGKKDTKILPNNNYNNYYNNEDEEEDEDVDDDGDDSCDNDTSAPSSTSARKWTTKEDNLLLQAVEQCGTNPPKCWKAIAKKVPGRNDQQCLQRWKNVLACKYRKGMWTTKEDDILRECHEKYKDIVKSSGESGEKVQTWDMRAAASLKRTPKQCRERWANILDPNLRNEDFTEEEDQKIISLHKEHGNKWKKIASFLEGRTGNRVKSRFNSLSRKKE